jgi:hypothetical protein
MSTTPRYVPSDVLSESQSEALKRVLDDDIAIRKLMAKRAVDLLRAKQEQVRPNLFEHRMLANRSFRAEIAAMLNITEKAAENLIGYSAVLVDAFPRTLDALAEGGISWQHATVIVDELAGLAKESRESVETTALAEAPFTTPHKLGRIVRAARELAEPASIPERHEAARKFHGVELLDDRDGMGGLLVRLPSVTSHAAFDRLTRVAKGIGGPLETRTLTQRRADVLAHVMLAEIDGEVFGVVPDEIDDERFVKWFRGIKPEVVISVPVLTLLGQSEEPATLDGWVPIDPASARTLVGESKSFIRILTHPETGVVLSVGRKRYKTPKDMRRLLQIRDLICRFPGCMMAASRADVDHIVEWQDGGETKVSNLQHLCRGHHSLKGKTNWTVTASTEEPGALIWTTPGGFSYITRPHRPMTA